MSPALSSLISAEMISVGGFMMSLFFGPRIPSTSGVSPFVFETVPSKRNGLGAFLQFFRQPIREGLVEVLFCRARLYSGRGTGDFLRRKLGFPKTRRLEHASRWFIDGRWKSSIKVPNTAMDRVDWDLRQSIVK